MTTCHLLLEEGFMGRASNENTAFTSLLSRKLLSNSEANLVCAQYITTCTVLTQIELDQEMKQAYLCWEMMAWRA